MRVALLFGGESSEHEVSCASARGVLGALDPAKYDVILIGADRTGAWHRVDSIDDLATAPGPRVPDLAGIDVVIPVLHGLNGEDGTVQGLLQLLGVPFVGCGVLSSALAMDKHLTGAVLRSAGVDAIDGIAVASPAELPTVHTYPVFVKPNRAGSSVGAARVDSAAALETAVLAALEHDDLALVQPLNTGVEIDVGVLQLASGELVAGAPLRVRPAEGSTFFDFAAKYTTGGATFEVPAALAPGVTEHLQGLAKRAFTALRCEGLARVDFFVSSDGAAQVNEVNTLPGLSALSQFPRMMAAVGLDLTAVLDTLIARAVGVGARV